MVFVVYVLMPHGPYIGAVPATLIVTNAFNVMESLALVVVNNRPYIPYSQKYRIHSFLFFHVFYNIYNFFPH